MLTMEDTHAIAEDVISGFRQLLQRDQEIINDFLVAFERRGQFAGLPETGGLAHGLEEVLAGLLSSAFTIRPLETSISPIVISPSFVQNFDATVRKLAARRPVALLLFKKHSLRRKCRPEEALAALFRAYSANADAYPY